MPAIPCIKIGTWENVSLVLVITDVDPGFNWVQGGTKTFGL